ncbi:MAG: hypothetical protein RJB01_149 [Actinomycetota bacterium]
MSEPAGAFLAAEGRLREREASTAAWRPGDKPLPALYLSHGAPPLLEDAAWIAALDNWMRDLPRPTAIVIVSAHWESAPLSISAAAAGTPLVYDFGGFHPYYYGMQYATPDASALADRIAAMMPDSMPVHRHTSRGLDHGAWVPLKVMFPNAEIPVVQLSIPSHDPDALMALGVALAPLRHEGVLIIGSGYMTHGLPFLTSENWNDSSIPSWSRDFDQWATELIDAGDIDALANYASTAPGMPYAHPTVEHFSPIFVTLGAGLVGASGEPRSVEWSVDGYRWGLSRKSFTLN